MFCARPAAATLSGQSPRYVDSFRVWGSAAVTGNTLTYDDGTTNFAMIPGGTDGLINELPPGAEVQAAYLFWSASYDPASPNFVEPDHDLRFSTPSGGQYDLSVDFLEPGEPPSAASFNRCVTVNEPSNGFMQNYYMCRRDVSAQVSAGAWLNGAYHVDGVDAVVGNCDIDPICQSKYAGWSLIVVWSSPTERVRRDVVLYDGFYLFDEEQGPPFSSGVSPFFTLGHFEVGETPRGSLSFFGLEGDEQLGVPPQDLQGCPTCYDFFEMYTEQNSTRTKLSDDVNPPNNVFNGSRSRGGMSPGVDLDTFDIGPLLRSGDSYLRFRVGSGDGVEGGELGGGELALLGYVIISLDTYAPNLDDTGTFKSVAEDRASAGSLLHYTVRVANQDGSAAAHNVRLYDPLPEGTVYVAGSTTACGQAVADIGGQSPLQTSAGLNIGTLFERPPGVQSCEVKFQARILDATAPGTELHNVVTIDSDETEPFTREARTLVEGIQLGTPTKTVTDLDGGDLVPGDAITYTLTLRNDSDGSVAGIEISDQLPSELENVQILLIPAGAVDASTPGSILVQNVSIGPRSTASVVVSASVRMGTASGTVIANQALVSHASLPTPILTDDPATPMPQDPTLITVHYATDLHSSSKTGVDVNGGDPEPGDLLRYTITFSNTGSVAAHAHLLDDFPFGVEACRVVHRPSGSSLACFPGGAQNSGQVSGDVLVPAGASRQLVFEVQISAGADSDLRILNQAQLTYDEDPADLIELTSQAFVVVARPVLLSSTKVAEDLDGAPTRPGDQIRYTLTIRNSGNRPATRVVVRDRVNANLENVSADNGGTFDGTVITWNPVTTPALASLAAGDEVVLHFVANVRVDVANQTVLRNVAAVVSNEISQPVLLRANPLLVRAEPILVMQKTVQDLNGGDFEPGDSLRYSLLIRNEGDAAATQLRVQDPIDPSLAELNPDSGGLVQGSSIVWDASGSPGLQQLEVGASISLHFDAVLIDHLLDGTLVSNQASVLSTEVTRPVLSDDPAKPGMQDPTVFQVHAQPVLSLTKQVVDDNGGDFVPGETVTYTLTIENTGTGAAQNLQLDDVFPAQLSDIQASPVASQQSAQALRWDASTLSSLALLWPNDPIQIVVTARIVSPLADGSAVSNQAQLQADALPVLLSDNPDTPAAGDPTVFFVHSMPVLSDFTKQVEDLDGDGIFRPGDRIRYSLQVRNTGSEDALQVQISDHLDAALSNITAAQGRVSGQDVVFDASSLAGLARMTPGAEQSLVIEATLIRPLDSGLIVSNQARVEAQGLAAELSDDPQTEATDDPTNFAVTSAPDLSSFSKQVIDRNGGSVKPGDLLDYVLVLKNTGDANAHDLSVEDKIDTNLDVTTVGEGGQFAAGKIVWNATQHAPLAQLNVDQQITLHFTAQVHSPLDNNTRIANQASLQALGIDTPVPSDDPDTAAEDDATVVFVVSAADLSLTSKRALDQNGQVLTQAHPGDVMSYEIVLNNSGDAVARDVVVEDLIDANLTTGAIGEGGHLQGQQITWDATTTPGLAALQPGEQVRLHVSVALNLPLDNDLLISNQALIRVNDAVNPFVSDDPATPERGDATLVRVVSAPDLSNFAKTVSDDNGGDFEPGDLVHYDLVVSNRGDAIARDLVVEDLINTSQLEDITSSQGRWDGSKLIFDSSSEPALAELGVGAGSALHLRFDARLVFPLANATVVSNQASLQAQDISPILSDDPLTPANDDPTLLHVVSQPKLVLQKRLLFPESRIAPPDGEVVYELRINNGGTATAPATVLTDVLPADLVFVSSDQGTFNTANNTLTVNMGDIPAREAGPTITLHARVRDTVADETRIANQASVVSTGQPVLLSDDPDTAAEADSTDLTVRAIIDLAATTKTVVDLDGEALRPGDLLRYTISVVNQGNSPARQVIVRDPLDSALELDVIGMGGRLDGGDVLWDSTSLPALAALAPGEPVDLVFTARVALDRQDGDVISNQAQISHAGNAEVFVSDDPATPAVPGDPTRVTVQAPRLQFNLVAEDENGAPLRPGDVVAYHLRAKNIGSVALRTLQIDDVLPDFVSVEEIGQGGQLTAGAVQWTADTSPALQQIEAGATADLLLRLKVDPRALGGTVIEHQASASSDDLNAVQLSDDPATAPAPDPTRLVVEAEVDFTSSVKRAVDAPDPLQPGDRVNFEIQVVNSGSQYAFDVEVNDLIDASQWRDALVQDGGLSDDAGLHWNATTTPDLAEMAPGEEHILHLSAVVNEGLSNGVFVENSAAIVEANGAQFNTPPARLRVMALPGLSASSKTVVDLNGGEVEPGDLLRYDIEVRNSGEAVDDVVLRDPPPAGTRFVPGSLLVNGSLPDGAGDGTLLQQGLSLGGLAHGVGIPVSFTVQVLDDVIRGTVISNQAWMAAAGEQEVGSDDPRTTGSIGDPTRVVVGGGAVLVASLQARPRRINSDDSFDLVMNIENVGNHPAQNVLLRLPNPYATQVEFVPDSIRLDAQSLTDGADDDAGQLMQDAVQVELEQLDPGQVHQLRARLTTSLEDSVLYFQAEMLSNDFGEPQYSDGDPASPGLQRTAVYVGRVEADLAGSNLSAVDLNGGLLQAADQIRYVLVLTNTGSGSVLLSAETGLVDQLGDRVHLVDGSIDGDIPLQGTADSPTLQLAEDLELPSGARVSCSFVVQLRDDALAGQQVLNSARIEYGEAGHIDLSSRLIVGGLAGTGRLGGTVFEDLGGQPDLYDRDVDAPMQGFQVLLKRPGDPQPVASQIVDVNGAYSFATVPAGRLQMRVLSQTGALFKTLDFEQIQANQNQQQDVLIDPSGVIYDASTADPIAGAQVLLYVDDGDADPDNDVIAGPALLDPDQQGQITNEDGFYRFDVKPGQYRLQVLPRAASLIYPSALIPPKVDDDSQNPFGSFAQTNDLHQVVSAARPDLNGDTSYYLRFDIQGPDDEVLHNHVPLDAMRSQVSLVKSANHKRLTMGEIVTYSVRYHNRSARALDVEHDGGVNVVDTIPKGFKFVAGSARLEQIRAASDGSRRGQKLSEADPKGNRILVFGPYPLAAGGEYLLRYQLVPTPQVEVGDHDNSAVLRLVQGQTAISNVSVARVKIVPDPTFDLSTVVGKVYCDDDEDGFQDPGEAPLPGVMIYSDTGRHAESDLGGKFHFSGIAPGSHLLKLDWRSLPPESTLTTPERLSFYATPGLPVRVSYGVRCVFDKHSADEVILAKEDAGVEDAGPEDAGPASAAFVHLTGVASQRLLQLDGVTQAVMHVDLGIGLGDDERDYSYGGGPNAADIDPVSGLAEPLHFYPRVVTALPVSDWRLDITTSGGQAIYSFSGEGLPPDDIAWDGRGRETAAVFLLKGAEYYARLRVNSFGLDWGASAPRNFAVGLGLQAVPQLEASAKAISERIDESKGKLFTRHNAPRRALRRFVNKLVAQLKKRPKDIVVIEVHSDNKAGDKALELTQARADRLHKMLVKAGVTNAQIHARGRGAEQPLVPNIGARGRSRNRRVEIRSFKPAMRGANLPPIKSQMRLLVNGREQAVVDESTAFEQTFQVQMNQPIDVDLTAPNGTQIFMHRVYTGAPWNTGVPEAVGVKPVEIIGDIAENHILFAGQAHDLALLGTRIRALPESQDGQFVVTDKGLKSDIAFQILTPASAAIAHWRVSVFAAPDKKDKAAGPASQKSSANLPGSGGDMPADGASAAPLASPPVTSSPVAVPPGETADTASSAAASFAIGAQQKLAPLSVFRPQQKAAQTSTQPAFGPLLYSEEGEGAPPADWRWQGKNSAGTLIVKPGVYALRLDIESANGDHVLTAPQWFMLRGREQVASLLLQNPFARTTRLGRKSRRAINRLIKGHKASDLRVKIIAHTDNSLKPEQAAEQTRRWAQSIADYLGKKGYSATQIQTVAMGSNSPLVPNIGRRNKLRNRRVEVQLLSQSAQQQLPPAPRYALAVESNGQSVDVDTMGRFKAQRFPTRAGVIQVRLTLPSGQQALLVYHQPRAELQATADPLVQPLVPLASADAGMLSEDAANSTALALASPVDDDSDFDPEVLGVPVLVQLPSEDGGVMVETEDGGTALVLQAAAVSPGQSHLDGVSAAAAGIRAAQLMVEWPREGSQVRSRRIVVRGKTDPLNKITVNGEAQDVDPETGTFLAIAQVPEGSSTLRVESVDEKGNKAIARREVLVDSSGLFWLGLAEGSMAGREANLAEWTPVNHYKLGPVALYGRGAALLKSDWHSEGFFKDYKLTLHVDTARWNQDAFARELIDPERYMPVYADSSTEVIDAEARYPLYVELRADRSHVRVGNFHTALKSGDLFRYDRARYGLNGRFAKKLWLQEDGTARVDADVRTFVAGGDAPRRHGRAELRGTGGSLYYLPNDNVVEGSERIAVLVRDAVTGSVLMRRPLARNIDYSIRYLEGRILLNVPLSSVAEGGFIANQNLSTVYAGHPLSLEVEYEHEGEGDFNQVGVGVWTEDTLYGHVTLGGGYVYEGRANEAPAYQTAGLHLRLAYDERNFVQGEWAYSSASAMDNYISTDGGLSFARLGQQPGDPDLLVNNQLYSGARDGHAFKLRAQTALGQLFGAAPDALASSAYFQRMDPGFSTGISAVEAGQTKYGVQSRYLISDKDQLRLRYDGVWSEFAQMSQLDAERSLHRELLSLQYQRRQGALSLTGEYAFAYAWDSGNTAEPTPLVREVWGNTLAAGGEYQLNKRWVLLARQEAILSGDERLLQQWNDHLVTSVGLRYQMFKNLQLSALESLRWSGENATTIGLQTKLNDKTDVYTRERFNMRGGSWVSSSVIGASSQVTDSTRAHGEYQLDGAASGQQTRAVMGLATQWKLMQGLALQVGYERTQVFGGAGYAPATGAMQSAALTDSYAFAAGGSQGNQAFYMGSGSRDALSAALDFTRLKTFKSSLKLELRYDDLDERRGAQDRLVLLTQGAMTWQWQRDLALLGRFNLADVENLSLQRSEAGLQDISLGLAYRPVDHEWISVLSKYGRRLEHRPLSLVNGSFEEYSADVLSLEPILELPWHLQLVEKLAFKYSREQIDDLPVGSAFTLLWINRLNLHLMRMLKPYVDFFPGDIDLGGEWRVLNQLSSGTSKQGLLFELSYAPYEFVRLGMGWNFSSFSDDAFARNDEDASGFFFRVVGQY